jgi:GWxTD domain-containing protein
MHIMIHIRLCVTSLAGALLFGAAAAHAQQDGARAELRLALEAAARGDTASALEGLERAVALQPRLAEAHFQRGLLLSRRASADPFRFEDRTRAEAAFNEALRYDRDNPLYLLELGKLMLKQQIRVDGERVLQRALAAAARADAATFAEVHFQLALFRETMWLRLRDRRALPAGREQIDPVAAASDARYAWDLIEHAMYAGPEQGAAERNIMVRHLRAALNADPAHAGAAYHLLAYQYDVESGEEFLETARRFARHAPAEPRAYLSLGLGYYTAGEIDRAAGAFAYALELMPEPERRHFESVARLLARRDAGEYLDLDDDARAAYERRFWREADPLLLTEANESWLEYMARMTYADMRFGLAEYGIRGWETDRGAIWVRYGRPERTASFPPTTGDIGLEHPGQITTVWSYGRLGPVFLFRQNPGFRRATFAGDFRSYAENYRSRQAASFDTPSLPERVRLPIQAVRFRGADGMMDVEVHAGVPLDRLSGAHRSASPLQLGLFVQDQDAIEISRETRQLAAAVGPGAGERNESWRIALPWDRTHFLGVEARDAVSWSAAVGRLRVPPRRFPAGALTVSDLLLADRIEPLVESPAARADFRLTPNPARTFGGNADVGFYFEIYNLLPDAEHFASYELDLSVRVEEIHRRTALEQIIGGIADRWGLSRAGTDAVQLRFERQARVLARDLIPEYFRITLDDAPQGRYTVQLVVRDRNAGREASAEQEFWIGEVRR